MGPLTFERQCSIVTDHLDDAVAKGARIIMGGKRTGMFIEPTVLVDVDHSMKIMMEETFGPTMPIMKVADDTHAIQMANHSDMGLSAYVWSRDLKHAERVGRQLNVGVVNINDTMSHYSVARLPFGGTKLSGNHVLETIALDDDPGFTAAGPRSDRPSRGMYRANRHQSPFSIRSQA